MEPKFNLDREKITDEEINSHKDFDKLVKQFKQQSIVKARSDVSFLKNKKATYSAIIAGVTVICTVTYFTVFKKQPPKENTHDKIVTTQNTSGTSSNKPNTSFIAPPISKLNVPYTAYKVNNAQGATIKHKSNSKIIIPKKAFVNKQGQDIVGDVEIQYREFHNQADIIASGIPMKYDSAGITTHFESAGMLDIRGYQNGEPVFINPNKTITIEFASEHTQDKYNMYELDTIAKNWTYIGRDNSLKNRSENRDMRIEDQHSNNKEQTTDNQKTKELQKQIDAIPPKIENEKTVYTKKVNQLPKAIEPAKPSKSNASRPKFELDVNYKEFPELAAFKNAVFEIGTENKNYTPELSNITWSSAEISEGPKKGSNYLLTLKLRERVEKLIVYPTLTGADYEIAIDAYNKKFENYKTLVAKRQADEQKLKEDFEAKQTAYLAEQKKLSEDLVKERARLFQEQEKQLAAQFNTMDNNMRVTRIFNIKRFGICNSDCPTNIPKEASMNPIFVVGNGDNFIKAQQVYLISHTKNLVFNYRNEALAYNPNDVYSVCVLSPEGKMYVCNKEEFAKCTQTKQNKIPVKELSVDVDNPDDLRLALGI